MGNHVACLLIMFLKGRLAMPYIGHENVRHATLLFLRRGRRALVNRGTGEGEIIMSCSQAKVEKAYQDVRSFCRENPHCTSLDEVKVSRDLGDDSTWGLSAKEEKALKRKCDWLGI